MVRTPLDSSDLGPGIAPMKARAGMAPDRSGRVTVSDAPSMSYTSMMGKLS